MLRLPRGDREQSGRGGGGGGGGGWAAYFGALCGGKRGHEIIREILLEVLPSCEDLVKNGHQKEAQECSISSV